MTEFDAQHHQAVVGLMQHGNFPTMIKFHVDFSRAFFEAGGYPAAPFFRICPVMMEFIIRHASTLKKLALILPNKLVGNSDLVVEYEAKLEQLCEGFSKMKLHRLGVSIPGHEVVRKLCK